MRIFIAASFIAFASILSSCSRPGVSSSSELAPELSNDSSSVVIFATNDLRGALLPVEPGHGGAAWLEAYYRAAHREWGSRAVWLDAGDLEGPSLTDGFDHGATFAQFLETSGMAATPQSAPKMIDAGRLRIGVINGSTEQVLLAQASEARNQGAQLVVLLSHLPIRCNPTPMVLHAVLRRPGEPNGFCEGPLYDVVSKLPEGTLNAIIVSGEGAPLERFIYPRYSSDPMAGIPVVEASPFGREFNLIQLSYDFSAKHAAFSKTRIEGPIEAAAGTFRGRPIRADRATLSLTRPAQTWVDAQNKIVLATSDMPLSGASLIESGDRESILGDLVADALREETHSDFAIIEPGLTQNAFGGAVLPEGTISQIALDRALPDDGAVLVVPVSGQELKTLVRISENGSRGFAAVSGMKLRLIRPDRNAPTADLDGDRKISLWERNRLLEMTDLNDDSIAPRKTYLLAAPQYLIEGGDDWAWASQHFHLADRAQNHAEGQSSAGSYPSLRALVAEYLKKIGKIGDVPERIRFENPPGRHARRRHHHHPVHPHHRHRRHRAGRL